MSARPSIRKRLAISYAALSLVLFGAMAASVYWAFSSRLDQLQAQEVQGLASTVTHLLEDAVAGTDPSSLNHRLDDVRLGHRGMHIWLLNADGSLQYGDVPMPTTLPEPDASGLRRIRLADGREVTGIQRGLAPPLSKHYRWMLLLVDRAEQRKLLESLARALILALLLGVSMATVVGVVLSGRALRPLQTLSGRANAISGTSIDARLPQEGVDAELCDLVGSFNRALERIEAAFRQQEGFSADVAHELNTPLATLIAGTELALAAQLSEAQLREILANGLEDLHRLEAIVKDMLFLARVDQGATARRSPATSISRIVRDVLEYYEAVIAEAEIAVRVDGDCMAEVDEPLLKRAISNLLSNATRFADPGSVLQIAIECDNEQVQLSVQNRGKSIPPERLSRIFDRFYRLDESRSQSDQHHGLGLAIVSAIAKMHEGNTFATSAHGITTVGLLFRRIAHQTGDLSPSVNRDRIALPNSA